MLIVDESDRAERGRLALLDFGLVAELGAREREGMVRQATQLGSRPTPADSGGGRGTGWRASSGIEIGRTPDDVLSSSSFVTYIAEGWCSRILVAAVFEAKKRNTCVVLTCSQCAIRENLHRFVSRSTA